MEGIPRPPAERSETIFSYQGTAIAYGLMIMKRRGEEIIQQTPERTYFWQISKTGDSRRSVTPVAVQLHLGIPIR